ncbi:hypothetical protein AB0O69_02515 [Streptomyces xiamenensis]|nr:hypothetical protein [Streptomyces sp. XC 2026]
MRRNPAIAADLSAPRRADEQHERPGEQPRPSHPSAKYTWVA